MNWIEIKKKNPWRSQVAESIRFVSALFLLTTYEQTIHKKTRLRWEI